ncbi:MAG: PD-(D/E)XK nuclease family protein [Acidimicrobiales bacterium]
MVDELLALEEARPRFPPALAGSLRRRMEEALAPIAGALDRPLRMGKHDIGSVHTCEAYYRAEKDHFSWAPRNAYGAVAHRALRLSISLREDLPPLDLVDMAMDAFVGEDQAKGSLGRYLQSASTLELAELRAQANDVVVLFLECFPPLRREWRPRTDTPILVSFCADRISLRGRPDLAFGQARGDEAGVLIVDLKTGRSYPHHLDDLRFYALLQTLKVGVPPYRVASYYLDSATFHAEDVTASTLEIAAGRTVDGVRKIARLLQEAGPAAITPGAACRWCRLRDDCEGPAQLVDQED